MEKRFPSFYTRIPNAADWSRVSLRLIDEELDLAQWDVNSFSRRLDMKAGISYRDFEITSPKGHQIRVHVEHINNMAQPDLCLIKYSVTSINYTGRISLIPSLDAVIVNKDDDPNEKIWNILRSGVTKDCAYLWTQTRREDAQVCYAMTYQSSRTAKKPPRTRYALKRRTNRVQHRGRCETGRQCNAHQIYRYKFVAL